MEQEFLPLLRDTSDIIIKEDYTDGDCGLVSVLLIFLIFSPYSSE
jgi:hypothetical protein